MIFFLLYKILIHLILSYLKDIPVRPFFEITMAYSDLCTRLRKFSFYNEWLTLSRASETMVLVNVVPMLLPMTMAKACAKLHQIRRTYSFDFFTYLCIFVNFFIRCHEVINKSVDFLNFFSLTRLQALKDAKKMLWLSCAKVIGSTYIIKQYRVLALSSNHATVMWRADM